MLTSWGLPPLPWFSNCCAKALNQNFQNQGMGGTTIQLVTLTVPGAYTIPIPPTATAVDMIVYGGGGGGGGYESATH